MFFSLCCGACSFARIQSVAASAEIIHELVKSLSTTAFCQSIRLSCFVFGKARIIAINRQLFRDTRSLAD
jgi:hypothetical protein